MDILCTCCGEPWDMTHVLHEAPEAFERLDGLILACPVCQGHRPADQTPEERARLDEVRNIAQVMGHDLDGLAAMLCDFGFTFC